MLSLMIGIYLLVASHGIQQSPSTCEPCVPPFWGGVLAGQSTKDHVLRLYGSGVFTPNEGDSGGTYYRDSKRSITLHVVYYTDEMVGALELIQGNALPSSARASSGAVSRYLKPPFLFEGLTFGATEAAVLSRMGTPSREEKDEEGLRTLVFLSTCGWDLESGISFVFRRSRLVKVIYWAASG